MKDEVKRIMKLVQEGKLSPDDAADLIEAFNDAPDEEELEAAAVGAAQGSSTEEAGAGSTTSTGAGPSTSKTDPIGAFVGVIEGITKDVSTKVDWNDIVSQVRQGVHKGVDAIKKAADEAKIGQGFTFLFGNSESKEVKMPLHVPAGKTLKVEAFSGSISVVGRDDLGQFDVKATFRAATAEDAKHKASLYTPVIEETEQHVILKLQDGPEGEVQAKINVPFGTPVDARTESGKITIRDIHASVRAHGSSADFEGSGIQGMVEIGLASGDVKLSDVESPMLSIETKSGDLRLDRVKGVMNLRTSSGDVTLTEGSGRTISVDAASGDIRLDIDKPVDGSVNVRAVSGDVTVEIPDSSDARVSISTLRGDVNCGLELSDKVQSAGKVNGRLGAGTGSIDLSAVSGDVRLEMRGAKSVQSPEEPAEAPKAPDAPAEPEAPKADPDEPLDFRG